MEWNIGLTIADVNGITALDCAYKKGDRACVELLLENGAPKTVLDALGQAPSQLMPESVDPSYDCVTDIVMATGDHSGLEESLSGASPSRSTDLKHKISGDETSVGNPKRVYWEWLDQNDTHNPFASASKVAASGSMSGGQHNVSICSQEMRRMP